MNTTNKIIRAVLPTIVTVLLVLPAVAKNTAKAKPPATITYPIKMPPLEYDHN